MRKVYLDNAATTPVSDEVIESMVKNLKQTYGNPSSSHHFGREAKGQLEEARRKIATAIHAKPSQICFTSCGTESNNSVLKNAFQSLQIERILVSPIEHPSIHATIKEVAQDIEIVYLPIDKFGSILTDSLEKLLSEGNKKTLVSVMHANNEVGALNNIETICKISKKYNAFVHSDMVQTMGHLPLNMEALGIDFVAASAHKFHGPKGVGFLYIKNPNCLKPFISGGSQERGMRSGTENMASIIGMSVALEHAVKNIADDEAYVNNLRKSMAEKLGNTILDIEIITNLENSLYTVLTIGFPEIMSNDMLTFQLDMKGIACSSGSACSSGANKGSHVLEALNYPKERKAIRFSFSKFNKMDEIEYAVEKIVELYNETVK
jgi:cysteine desulfurase